MKSIIFATIFVVSLLSISAATLYNAKTIRSIEKEVINMKEQYIKGQNELSKNKQAIKSKTVNTKEQQNIGENNLNKKKQNIKHVETVATIDSESNNHSEKVEIVKKGDTSFIFYTNSTGEKIKIDEETITNKYYSGRDIFKDLELSPEKKYITYSFLNGEGSMTYRLYDIDKRNFGFEGVTKPVFSLDDKYVIICGRERQMPVISVYSSLEEKTIFDVFGGFCDGAGEGCENKHGSDFYNGYEIANCDYTGLKEGTFKATIEKTEGEKVLDTKEFKYELE